MSKYRSEDDAPIVDSPVVGGEGEAISAVPTTEPDLPPAAPQEPIADVDSTRGADGNEDKTVPEQRFRFSSEDAVAAPAAPTEEPAPAEAPASPMDAPAGVPAADAAPADAPVAPEAAPAAPADGTVAPVADVPAAAEIVEPQPEAEVTPAAPADGEVPAAATVAPEVAAPAEAPAPVEPAASEPVNDQVDKDATMCGGKKGFKQEGEEISVVETPEPRVPAETEAETCPETGADCDVKDIKDPINPVIEQTDDLAEDVGTEAPAPAEEPKTNDITEITPEEAQDANDLSTEIEQCMRMEGEAEAEAGDQDVNATVNVNVRKDDGDEHADDSADAGADVADNGDQAEQPAQFFRQDGEEKIETIADIVNDPAPEDIVPVPDPNSGAPDASGDPEQMFNSWMQEGGSWL